MAGGKVNSSPAPVRPAAPAVVSGATQRARVLCDYDAKDATELSLMTDEMITVQKIEGEPDYMLAERGQRQGRVPTAFLELVAAK